MCGHPLLQAKCEIKEYQLNQPSGDTGYWYPTQRQHSATEPLLFWIGAIFITGPQTTMH